MAARYGMGGLPMFHGQLLGIYITPDKCAALQAVDHIEAVPGKGLAGDRYFLREGTYSKKAGPDREVTLIESEALEGLAREYGIAIEPAEARRNLLTGGVP